MPPAPSPAPEAVLARVVLPLDGRALPLHVDGADPDTPTAAGVLDRRRVRVPAGTRVSYATWFAAFPAGHWARHTSVREVRLDVRLTGPGTVEVFASGRTGRARRVDGTVHPLTEGWLWFDVVAGDGDVVLERADWCAEPVPAGRAVVAVTTHDRPASALALLERLAAEPEALSVVAEVVVVDQGTDRLRDRPGFAEVEASLDGRLRVLEQPNLGGSGGFARGMLEALDAGAPYVLLLDDDVVLEPESVRRAVAFADRCTRPTLVAGSMLDLRRPTVLHTAGERVDRDRFLWEVVPPGRLDHDLATGGLRSTPWLHEVLEPEFGAWWSCLVPTAALRDIGLALPLFLKWDDVELGLRAGAAGFPTVALPGVGVWHEPWAGKDDVLDWQAYFHSRNRVVAALLHSPTRRGLRMLAESLEHTLRPLVAMRYAVVAMRLRSLEDVLAGPQDLHPSLATRLEQVRALRERYADGRPVDAADHGPPPEVPRPRSRPAELVRLAAEVLRTSVRSGGSPQATVPDAASHWWRLARLDGALVTTPSGRTYAHRRDARTALPLLARSLVLHARLVAGWPRLRAAYRAALPDLVSPQAWERTLVRPAVRRG